VAVVPPSVGKVVLVLLACWLTTGVIACWRGGSGSSLFMVMPSESAAWFYAMLAAGGFVVEALGCVLLASIAHRVWKGSEFVVYGLSVLVALGFIFVVLG